MLQKTTLLVSYILLALVTASIAQNFVGTWTSGFGAPTHVGPKFYICQTPGGRTQGVFSNYGFVDGIVTIDTPTGLSRFDGTWFTAGARGSFAGPGQYNTYFPNYGQIILLQNGTTFSGAWSYANDPVTPTYGTVGLWSENLLDTSPPASRDCWASDFSSNTIAGQLWRVSDDGDSDSDWAICPNNVFQLPLGLSNPSIGTYDGSYWFTDGTTGATVGNCSSNPAVCQFSFSEENDDLGWVNQGMYLVRQIDASTMYAAGWTNYSTTFEWTSDPDVFNMFEYFSAGEEVVTNDCLCYSPLICTIITCPPNIPTAPPAKHPIPNWALFLMIAAPVTVVILIVVAILLARSCSRHLHHHSYQQHHNESQSVNRDAHSFGYGTSGAIQAERPVPETTWPLKHSYERPPAGGFYSPPAAGKTFQDASLPPAPIPYDGVPPYIPNAEEEAAARRKVSSVDN